VWTFASVFFFRFPNCWLPGWGRQPHAQPPTWRTRSPYLYPLETGWSSYNPRHRIPILVAFYDLVVFLLRPDVLTFVVFLSPSQPG
jgi:hypothetical protein